MNAGVEAAAPALAAGQAATGQRERREWWPLLLLAPALVLLVALLAAPALYVGWLSLTDASYGPQSRFVGLDNYVRLFADPAFWRALWNTFLVVNGVVYGELLLGLGVAVLLRAPLQGKRWAIAAILAPYAITESSGIVMWRAMLEPDVGMVTGALSRIGLALPDWSSDPAVALALAAVIAIWHHMPFTFLILYAALLTVPKELTEAAAIDGAGPVRAFWLVELRLIMPAMLIAVLFRTIFAIRLFSEVWLLTQGGPARLSEVLAIYLYREMFRYHEFGVASATGWVMLVLSLLIALPYLRRMHRAGLQDG